VHESLPKRGLWIRRSGDRGGEAQHAQRPADPRLAALPESAFYAWWRIVQQRDAQGEAALAFVPLTVQTDAAARLRRGAHGEVPALRVAKPPNETGGVLLGFFATVVILNEVREGRQTPTYARQRFGAIKTVINYPPKRGKWAEDCARASAFCKALVPPRKSAVNPRPMTRENFNALLAASGPTMKALLLLMLNGCMYAKEAAAVTWAELDLVKKTLVSTRSKTGVVRVAALWDRTVHALKALSAGVSGAVFMGDTGMPMGYLEAYRRFKPVRKQAKLPTAQLSQIRDGSYNAAIEAGVDLNTVKLLAGHATGISDHYLKRRPTMVAAACRAIEKHILTRSTVAGGADV
jgi:integrase